jgi:hypothetical protein
MPRTIADIIADQRVTQEELEAIMSRFDTNQDGQLQGEEIRQFARAVAPLVEGSASDLIAILDFYQLDDDPALSAEEVQGFLELHL